MNKTHLLEFAGILFTAVAFIWEFRRASPPEQIVLWAILSLIISLLSLLMAGSYLNQKLKQLNENTDRIVLLEKDLNIRKMLEKINNRLSKLEGAFYDKLQR